ncbi:MAG: hypothetical protein C0444_07540 [Microbacterium sp.]|nr:hypothetical protein [Microbacterium sp.]MBA4346120.1 hypothetical protein [Microbacterium sp.]
MDPKPIGSLDVAELRNAAPLCRYLSGMVDPLYQRVLSTLRPPPTDACVVVSCYLFADREPLMTALDETLGIRLVVPRRRLPSDDPAFEQRYVFSSATTDEELADEIASVTATNPFVVLDSYLNLNRRVGSRLKELGSRYLGTVEDVPLLEPDDRTVSIFGSLLSDISRPSLADSIVYSIDRLMRPNNWVLRGRIVLVVGFGRVGEDVARALRQRECRVLVCEIDPVRKLVAVQAGFELVELTRGLPDSSVVVLATGKPVFGAAEASLLAGDAIVASVSSNDIRSAELFDDQADGDELVTVGLPGRQAHILNRGEVVNFREDAVVGPSFELLQAELFVSVLALATGLPLDDDSRDFRSRIIADAWLRTYGNVQD